MVDFQSDESVVTTISPHDLLIGVGGSPIVARQRLRTEA